jgi:hypothetical protein
MVSLAAAPSSIEYPSSDGEPLAETYDHLCAILNTFGVLKQLLKGQQATVLADQFMYYAQGYPKLRVAPNVMVIFGVEPDGRDNYKIWEEGQVPSVIFEMTSAGTRQQDVGFKQSLYEQLEVQEYWLFDPKGEWLEPPLQGYQLNRGEYIPITDSCSDVLDLRLAVEANYIAFFRRDNGERLLIPDELAAALQVELQARQAAEAKASEAEAKASEAEAQASAAEAQAAELEAKLQQYQERFGEL